MEHFYFFRFLVNIFNLFGLSSLKISKNNRLEFSKVWFSLNFFKLFSAHVPILYMLLDNNLYYYVFQNEIFLNFQFNLNYLHWVLMRCYFVIEAAEIIWMNSQYGLFFTLEIANLMTQTLEILELGSTHRKRMVESMKKVLIIAAITIVLNMTFLSQYWNHSSIFTILLSFFVEFCSYNIFNFFVFIKISEVFFVHVTMQLIQDIEEIDHFNHEKIDKFCFKYNCLMNSMRKFNDYFNKLMTVLMTTYLSYNVLKVYY